MLWAAARGRSRRSSVTYHRRRLPCDIRTRRWRRCCPRDATGATAGRLGARRCPAPECSLHLDAGWRQQRACSDQDCLWQRSANRGQRNEIRHRAFVGSRRRVGGDFHRPCRSRPDRAANPQSRKSGSSRRGHRSGRRAGPAASHHARNLERLRFWRRQCQYCFAPMVELLAAYRGSGRPRRPRCHLSTLLASILMAGSSNLLVNALSTANGFSIPR